MDGAFEVYNQLVKLMNRINENDKKPRDFGTGKILYTSEIHLIDAVGLGEGYNGSVLSEKMGVTNGAVTQITSKLLTKGMIRKVKKTGNNKEVYIQLTELGKVAYANHLELHRVLREKISQATEQMSNEQRVGLMNFLTVVEKNIPKF